MNAGMLWYDNSKRTLREKIIAAADYHRQKYGRVPNFCQVNTAQYEEIELGVLKVSPAKNILPGHLLIGVESR